MKRNYLECVSLCSKNYFYQIEADMNGKSFVNCQYKGSSLKRTIDNNNEVECPLLEDENEGN